MDAYNFIPEDGMELTEAKQLTQFKKEMDKMTKTLQTLT